MREERKKESEQTLETKKQAVRWKLKQLRTFKGIWVLRLFSSADNQFLLFWGWRPGGRWLEGKFIKNWRQAKGCCSPGKLAEWQPWQRAAYQANGRERRCSDLGNEILALNIQMSETELKNFQRNKLRKSVQFYMTWCSSLQHILVNTEIQSFGLEMLRACWFFTKPCKNCC